MSPTQPISSFSSSSNGARDSRATSPTLLAGVGSGNNAAWERLMACYRPTILAWCRTKGLDDATAQDVAQETFVSVAKSLPHFKTAPGSGAFRAWLWRITQYRILDMRRRELRQPNGIGGSSMAERMALIADSHADTNSSIVGHAKSTSIAQTLAELSKSYEPRTWQAFLRNVIDGRSTEEVAIEFQMTAVGVRQLRSRILRRLRQRLEIDLSRREPQRHREHREET